MLWFIISKDIFYQICGVKHMSLRFIYGRAGSGKSTVCLNEIKQQLDAGATNALILLVPEQFSFQAERDLIAVIGKGGILKTEVLSFRRLAFRIFNEVGGMTCPHIHPAGKCMILYRLLDKLGKSMQVFSRSAEQHGFVSSISSIITEFKRYNVTPPALAEAEGKLTDGNSLKIKLQDLHVLYSEYEKALSERYFDGDDELTLAAEKVLQASSYIGAEIWIDGFAGFTPQEFMVIRSLLGQAARVNISLCTDALEIRNESSDIFAPVKASYKRLLKMAEEQGVPVEPHVYLPDDPLPRFAESRELAHLERYLYNYSSCHSYQGKTRDLQLFSAVNIYSEIEAAARDIIRLCRDEGMRYNDIAVVTGNMKGYEKLIEVIFAEYGIPCFLDRKVDITNHPLIRLVLSTLEIFTENWSYEAVFSYLKTGLTGIDPEAVDKLENYVLACGIRGSRWTDGTDWKMASSLLPDQDDGTEAEDLLDINRIRSLVTDPLMGFREGTRNKNNAAVYCTAMYEFLCFLKVPESIEKCIDDFRMAGNLSLADEYSQVWNILMDVFDQVVEVMDDDTFGIERFANILRVGIAEYRIGLIPAALDQVLVGSVDRSKSHAIKALFLLGVNDGILPAFSVGEGILSDRDRIALKEYGLELASDTRTQAFEERFLVYRALTTPSKYLYVSWPIADQEGKALRPSTVIYRLRRLFPAVTESSNILPTESVEEELKLISARAPAFKMMVSAFRKKADGRSLQPVWPDAYCWYFTRPDWKRRCMTARQAFQYKNIAGSVSREKIAQLYGSPLRASVSRLEKYTSCPFAFYVQYGLGARERKVFALKPPDVGTFMHEAIEEVSKAVVAENVTWRTIDRDWCNDKVSEVIDGMLEKMGGSGIAASKRFTAIALRLKRVVARAVWLIALHIRRGGFEPVDYEAGFGDKEKYPSIIIELDNGEKISMTGRIDRIDKLKTSDETYLRIIDYKSGSKDFKLSDIYYGLQIQLLTYMDALWDNDTPGDGKNLLPGGMLYFKVDDPIIRSSGKLTEEEIEQAIMKQLKMKGLLLADVRLIREMDRDLEGTSQISPAVINKGDTLGKNSSAASLEQFRLLRKYIRKLLKDLGGEIVKGNVDISPYKKKGATSCRYCSFMPVCQFDTSMQGNSYRVLYDKDNDEVWRLMDEST